MILALDLSSKSSGWAVGNIKGELQAHGCITASSPNVLKRIAKMKKGIMSLIEEYKITKIVLEEVIPSDHKNPHTYKILTWLQGIILFSVFEFNENIDYELIPAVTWRKCLGMQQGKKVKREQAKQADIQYVDNKYKITANDDECDAICILDAYYIKEKQDKLDILDFSQ